MHVETMRQLVEVDPEEVDRESDPDLCEAQGQKGPKWQGTTQALPGQLRTLGGVFRAIITSFGESEAVAKLENGEPERFFEKGTQAVLTFDGRELEVAVREVDWYTGEVRLDLVARHLGLGGPESPLSSDSTDMRPEAAAASTTDVAPK
jgi:hypothetical protein